MTLSPPTDKLFLMCIPAMGCVNEKRALGVPSYITSLKELDVFRLLKDFPVFVWNTGNILHPRHISCGSFSNISAHVELILIHNMPIRQAKTNNHDMSAHSKIL